MPARYKLLALVLIGLTASVYAQTVAPTSPAAVLLRQRSELQLSKSQVRRLQEFDRQFIAQVRPIHERMRQARAAERRSRASDTQRTPRERREFAEGHNESRRDAARIAEIRRDIQGESMKVLTPSQRAKADSLRRDSHDPRKSLKTTWSTRRR